jgi:hypothetical protein
MAGLNLQMGGYSGASSSAAPSWGAPQSYDSISAAAFGPGATSSPASSASALNPMGPFGLATWVGIAAVVGLVAIRYSLPA